MTNKEFNAHITAQIEALRAKKWELEKKKNAALDVALWEENAGMRAIHDKRVTQYGRAAARIAQRIEALKSRYILGEAFN